MDAFRKAGFRIALVTGVALIVTAPATPQQQVSPPIARYTVDVGTVSGMAAMASGGGGLGAAMSMMRGGNQVAHEMVLRLGSTRTATGVPRGDHFLPDGMRMGRSVPLVTPTPTATRIERPDRPDQQLPRGRLLLFWGCGEHAPRGQPVVIDFARLAQGQVPPNLYFGGLNLPDDWTVLASTSTTYGDWPNGRETRPVPANASLLGTHRVASSYAPEISFNLQQDFMGPLNPSSAATPANAVALGWNGLPAATGYYAWAFGAQMDGRGGQPQDMVWWSSSSTQQFAGALTEWLAPSTVRRLIDAKTVLPPTQTTCTIPAEVKAASGEMLMASIYAYGPQADFAYPPRPAEARTPWRPEWIARVRYRSHAMVMTGMPAMGGMGAAEDGQDAAAPAGQQQQSTLPRCRGLAGIAARAAGLCQ
jgi:hypothetical protein